jgi:hypothetical protein
MLRTYMDLSIAALRNPMCRKDFRRRIRLDAHRLGRDPHVDVIRPDIFRRDG